MLENENGAGWESRLRSMRRMLLHSWHQCFLFLSQLLWTYVCGCLYDCAVCPISFCRIWKIEMHTATTASDGESWKRGTSHFTLSTDWTVCHFMPDNSTRSKHHSLSLVVWSTESKMGWKKSIKMNKSPSSFLWIWNFNSNHFRTNASLLASNRYRIWRDMKKCLVSSRFKCKRVAPTAHITKYSFLTQFRSIFNFSKSICGAQSTAFGHECWRKNRDLCDF